MIKKIYSYLKRTCDVLLGPFIGFYVEKNKELISLYYYTGTKNVGDVLNVYLIEKVSNLKVVRRRSGIYTNLVAIGSVMHMANKNSYIWGTGFISPKHLPKSLDLDKIKAVRGRETLRLLKENYSYKNENIALGDPAVLLPLFFNFKVDKKFKLGIIPHYVDYQRICSDIGDRGDIKIINVKQEPETFVKDILECEAIVSSSLHGLIFSDAYQIPNKWVIFSNKLVGGRFKFTDYYSTTDSPNEDAVVSSNKESTIRLIENFDNLTKVKKFIYCKEKLINSFPFLKST